MSRIEQSWRSRGFLSTALLPVSWFYGAVMRVRRWAYSQGFKKPEAVSLPVVVVGNLSVGGTGKTPLCAHLVQHFQQAGWRPGIVSRGYGGERHETPHLLQATDSADAVGDEPLMLFHQCNVPVCVCVHRRQAVACLAQHGKVDIVFADDGLQHLAMPRQAEILVIDGTRGFGNTRLLPAGPLRDSTALLASVNVVAIQVPATQGMASEALTETLTEADALNKAQLHSSLLKGSVGRQLVAHSSHRFALIPQIAVEISTGKELSLSAFQGLTVNAVAGIGHPERFFNTLKAQGIHVVGWPKKDHQAYTIGDVTFADAAPVLVTSKDAVKLRNLPMLPPNVYEIRTQLCMTDDLFEAINLLEKQLQRNYIRAVV